MKPLTMILQSLCLAIATVTSAQMQRDSVTPKSDQAMTVPNTQAGQANSLALGLGEGKENSIAGGVSFTTMFTDNIFLSSVGKRSDISYDVAPFLAWHQFTSKLSLSLSGGAGFIVNQRTSERNQAAEDFNIDLTYRVRRYVTLRFDNTFVNTSGLFSGINPSANQSGIGVMQQANSTLITPASHTLTNATLAEVTDQFSAHSNIGARAVVSILRYPDGAQSIVNVPLFEGQSYSVEAFYNHQLSAKQWTGLTLRAQRFDSQSSLVKTDAESAVLFYSVQLVPTVNISLFGGPQLSVTSIAPSLNIVVTSSDRRRWTPASGATLAWQKTHTSAHLSFVRQVNDGGGLFSAVMNETVQAGLRRQLSTRLQGTVAFTYAGNDTLVPGVTLHGYSGEAELSRRITNNLSAGVGYRFEQQGVAGFTQPARANRVWISLSYQVSRPLGQ